MNIMLML